MGRRQRQASSPGRRDDLGARRRIASTGAGRRSPARSRAGRRQQHGDRPADGERRHEAGQRLVAVVQRLADHDDGPPSVAGAGAPTRASTPRSRGPSARPALPRGGAPQLGRGQHRARRPGWHRGRGRPGLGPARSSPPGRRRRRPPTGRALRGVATIASARVWRSASTLSSRSVLQAQVDEQPGAHEHDAPSRARRGAVSRTRIGRRLTRRPRPCAAGSPRPRTVSIERTPKGRSIFSRR